MPLRHNTCIGTEQQKEKEKKETQNSITPTEVKALDSKDRRVQRNLKNIKFTWKDAGLTPRRPIGTFHGLGHRNDLGSQRTLACRQSVKT